MQRASLNELYSKTAVDQLVLARCHEQLLEERSPLSAPAQQWMVLTHPYPNLNLTVTLTRTPNPNPNANPNPNPRCTWRGN